MISRSDQCHSVWERAALDMKCYYPSTSLTNMSKVKRCFLHRLLCFVRVPVSRLLDRLWEDQSAQCREKRPLARDSDTIMSGPKVRAFGLDAVFETTPTFLRLSFVTLSFGPTALPAARQVPTQ